MARSTRALREAIGRTVRQPGRTPQQQIEQADREAKIERGIEAAYNIIEQLARRMGADKTAITVLSSEYNRVDPDTRLDIVVSDKGNVTLRIVPR